MSNLAASSRFNRRTENQDAKAAEIETADEAEVEMGVGQKSGLKSRARSATTRPLAYSAGEDADYVAFGRPSFRTSVIRDVFSPTGPPRIHDWNG